MNGFTKICVAALCLSFAFNARANEIELDVEQILLEDIVLSSGPTAETYAYDFAEEEITVELLPPPRDPLVEELLERARRENAQRANMRQSNLTDIECLATAVYHEARGEGYTGMLAVAFVIYNRVKSSLFPENGFCAVVLAKSQFSFTSDKYPDNIKDWDTYEKILAMVVDLVENDGFQSLASPVGNALFFNSFRSRSHWTYANARKFVATIGKHHFFK